MDVFDPVNRIKYSCYCDKQFSLPELYYCNGCQKTTCKFCITEEIDSYYCPNCLENMASAEAMLNHNRCKKCYECPICFCAMTYNVNGELYYLNCSSCHWNSLSIGMTADNPYNIKKESDKTLQQEFTKVLELVQREAREIAAMKDKNRPLRRRLPTRQSILTSPRVAHHQSRAPISLPDVEKAQEDKEKKMYTFPEISENTSIIPEYYYNIKDLNQISTTQQRLAHLQTVYPPVFIKDLIPVKKLLHTRRSKRCRKCDQLLIKPDLNFAAKIEFKRLRIAYTTLPRFIVARPLQVSEKGIVVEMIVTNPLHSVVDLNFSAVQLPYHTTQIIDLPPATYVAGMPEEDDEDESVDTTTNREPDDAKFVIKRVKNQIHLLVYLSNQTPTSTTTTALDRTQFGLGVAVKFQDSTAGAQDTAVKLDFDFKL